MCWSVQRYIQMPACHLGKFHHLFGGSISSSVIWFSFIVLTKWVLINMNIALGRAPGSCIPSTSAIQHLQYVIPISSSSPPPPPIRNHFSARREGVKSGADAPKLLPSCSSLSPAIHSECWCAPPIKHTCALIWGKKSKMGSTIPWGAPPDYNQIRSRGSIRCVDANFSLSAQWSERPQWAEGW